MQELANTFFEQKWPQLVAHASFYLCIGLFIGYFSSSPVYEYADSQTAELKLVVRHSGILVGQCRTLGDAELKKLPPNMRAPEICPREKSSMLVSLMVNGDAFYSAVINPAGLHRDGVLALYKRFTLRAGQVSVRLSIENGKDGLQVFEEVIKAAPADVLVLEYRDAGFHLSNAAQREAS